MHGAVQPKRMTTTTNFIFGSFRSLVLMLSVVRRVGGISITNHMVKQTKTCYNRVLEYWTNFFKSTSKLTIHAIKNIFVFVRKGSEILSNNQKNICWRFSFFSFFLRNCSHFKVRHVAQVHPVQIARPPPLHFGEGIKAGSRFAMPADFTINYTMWVSINRSLFLRNWLYEAEWKMPWTNR